MKAPATGAQGRRRGGWPWVVLWCWVGMCLACGSEATVEAPRPEVVEEQALEPELTDVVDPQAEVVQERALRTRFRPLSPRLDRTGTPLPPGASQRLGSLALRHPVPVVAVASAAAGRREGDWFVSADAEGSVRVWDAESGQLRQILTSPVPVLALAAAPEAALVAVGGGDGLVRLWDVRDGSQGAIIPTQCGEIGALALSGDGGWVAVGGERDLVQLFRTESGAHHADYLGHGVAVQDVAFSPDVQSLATLGRDGSLRVWSLLDGSRLLQVFDPAHGGLHRLAWSADSAWLAVSGRTVRVFDVQAGRQRLALDTQEQVQHTDVVFSSDQQSIYTCQGNSLRLWDSRSGAPRDVIRFEGMSLRAMTLVRPDRLALISGRRIVVVDPGSGREVWPASGHADGVTAVAFSPRGHRVATAGLDAWVYLWDVATGEVQARWRAPRVVTALAFSPDGTQVVTASPLDTLRVWDLHGKAVQVPLPGVGVSAMAANVDDQVVAFFGDRQVRWFVWGETSLEEVRIQAAVAEHVRVAALDPRGEVFAAAALEGGVLLCRKDEEACTDVLFGGDGPVWDLAFHPTERLLVTAVREREGGAGLVRLFSWEDGAVAGVVRGVRPRAVTFSPDGALLSFAEGDHIQLVERDGMRLRFAIPGHEGAVTSLSFSPDGRALASASADSAVLLWDMKPLRVFVAPVEVQAEEEAGHE